MGDRPSINLSDPPRADLPTALAILFTAGLPSLMIWLLFVALAGSDTPPILHLVVDVVWKVTTAAFPLLFMLLWERRRRACPGRAATTFSTASVSVRPSPPVSSPCISAGCGTRRCWRRRPPRPSASSKNSGLTSCRASCWLRRSSAWRIRFSKSTISAGSSSAGCARSYLCRPRSRRAALIFMAHHIILLSVYLPEHFWTLTIPLSLFIAIGGAIWSWLYARTGSLYAPWLSHALIDAAIAVVGWDVIHRGV